MGSPSDTSAHLFRWSQVGDHHEGSSLEHGRVRDLTVPRASSVPTGRMTAGFAFWGRWSSVCGGGSQGTPGLGGQRARWSPREEGRARWRSNVQGALWCRKHGPHRALNLFSPRSGHKVSNMPVRGYLCVPLHSLHKWKVFLLFPWMSSSMLTGRINLLSESCF